MGRDWDAALSAATTMWVNSIRQVCAMDMALSKDGLPVIPEWSHLSFSVTPTSPKTSTTVSKNGRCPRCTSLRCRRDSALSTQSNS